MRNQPSCGPSWCPRSTRHHAALIHGVERGGRLVEHQHRRVGEKRPRDGDALALAGRQRGAAFADDRVESGGSESTKGSSAARCAPPPPRRSRPAARSGCSRRSRRERRRAPDPRARRLTQTGEARSPRRSRPSRRTAPASGSSSRSSRSAIVDLPLPLGPTIASVSPARTRERHVRRAPARRDRRTASRASNSMSPARPTSSGARSGCSTTSGWRVEELATRAPATRARSRGARRGPSAPARGDSTRIWYAMNAANVPSVSVPSTTRRPP